MKRRWLLIGAYRLPSCLPTLTLSFALPSSSSLPSAPHIQSYPRLFLVTMPFRPRHSIPARCASLPPLYLECPGPIPRPAAALSTIPEVEDHFSWTRLPKEIQHGILRNTLALPDTGGHDAVFVGEQHKAHLLETVVPLFLGLGSWDAYLEAASVLYGHVYIPPTANKNAVLKLLSSPETLRVRNLIEELDMHIRMPYDLTLFNIELSNTQNNVHTVLHSMRIHGRLRRVDFFFYIPDLQTCHYDHGSTLEYDVLSLYLPMARLQVASRGFSISSRDTPQGAGTAVSRDVQPGSGIIAPAFLASRAFQSGLLPLLESNVFQSSTLTMRLFSIKDNYDIRNANIDGNSVFKYWFGATKVEDLPEKTRWLLPRNKPNDLFPFVPQARGSCDLHVIQRDGGSD